MSQKLPKYPQTVAVEWRSGSGSVCFVAVEYGEYWQAYVGPAKVVPTEFGPFAYQIIEDHETTERSVAMHGAKLSWQEAHAFFPHLKIERYKTYDKV